MALSPIIKAIAAGLPAAKLLLSAARACYLVYPPRPSFQKTLQTEASKGYLRDYDDAQGERYIVASFDGYELHAELLRAPKESNRYVIFSHGYSYDRHGSVKYTHLFRKLGFNCVIYDSRGHGLNKKAPCAFGVTEKNDLRALIEDCYARFGGDIVLGLHGESMGSAASALCLGDHPPVRFAVLDCGYADFRGVVEGKLRAFHLPRFEVFPVEWMCKMLFHVSILRARPEDALRQNEVPLCLIHGEADALIPVSHALRLQQANKGACELHIFPGAGHAQCFWRDEARYLQILKTFLSEIELPGGITT